MGKTQYEYTTRLYQTVPGRLDQPEEAQLAREGWQRAWADVTMQTTFVVYRRETK